MPFPAIAAVAGAAARALPMIASTAGRAAASGAARAGASEGVSGMAGKAASGAVRQSPGMLLGGGRESRTESFSQGAVAAQTQGMGMLPFTPDSLPTGAY